MKFTIAHAFCGIGGGALGSAAASARFGDHEATFETVGGTDFDELACRDFERLARAPALLGDMHELQPADLRRAWGNVAPDVVMSSPPCKGNSGLLSAKRALEEKYQRMNQLFLTSLHLLCSTWKQPPAILFFENVPRIQSRGKYLIAQAVSLLTAHGYAVHTGNHDCGEIGNLAQHRRRWFLLARHRSRVPQFVYHPAKHCVRACGEVLGPLPIPGDVARGGPMHSVPGISWRNWVRLALIPAGGDWRDLPGVVPEGGKRREQFRRSAVQAWESPAETVTGPGGSAAENVADPRWGGGRFGVADWREPMGTVAGESLPNNGKYSVADPRFGHVDKVTPWSEPVGTITRSPAPSSGAGAVADPRFSRRHGSLLVQEWGAPARTVTGADPTAQGGSSVADPRFVDGKKKNWQQVAGVTPWTSPAPVVTSQADIHAGAFSVGDPRIEAVDVAMRCEPRNDAYRVLSWQEASRCITGSLEIDNGAAAVADPRPVAGDLGADLAKLRPDRSPPFIPVIVAEDGTWHRPLTTLELAVLQSLPPTIDGEPLVLSGSSHTRWREAIGNCVPPKAGHAVGGELLKALLVSALGLWTLGSNGIWVAPEEALAL